MNIHCYGYRGITGQINRIEQGFRDLGHTTSFEEVPDLIYANDIGSWNRAIDTNVWGSEIILNILDLPTHLEHDLANQIKTVNFYKDKYKITTISDFVRNQLEHYCGLSAPIIYQPAKNICNLNLKRDFKYTIIGRNNDPRKGHSQITLPVIREIESSYDNLHVVGENIGVGNYHGVVTDEKLNEIYNRSQYIFVCGDFDGFGLQLVESILGGATPISYFWHPTAKEFIEKELIFDSKQSIIDFIKRNGKHNQKYYEGYKNKFSGLGVAKRILNEKIAN